MSKVCRGVRGATTSDSDSAEDILKATRELLALMIRKNDICSEDVASAIFTTTSDLTATFPAVAARQLKWMHVPLLCMHEMEVPGALSRCIRILLHWNTATPQAEIEHIYVKGAVQLRPDLSGGLSSHDEAELDRWIESYVEEE